MPFPMAPVAVQDVQSMSCTTFPASPLNASVAGFLLVMLLNESSGVLEPAAAGE